MTLFCTKVSLGSEQSISNGSGSWTTINFDTEDFDDDGMHNNSTNKSRLTAQRDGDYIFNAYIPWAANGSGIRWVKIKKYLNAGGSEDYAVVNVVPVSSSDLSEMCISATVNMAANDYVQIEVMQTSGGSLSIASTIVLTSYVTSPIVARVYHNTSQTISNVTWTALAFNSETFDTDTLHDTSTNNSRLTVERDGYYRINANASFASNSTGNRRMRFRVNGSTDWAAIKQNAVSGTTHDLSLSTLVRLSSSDYIEVEVYQNSTGSLSVPASPVFSIEQVG